MLFVEKSEFYPLVGVFMRLLSRQQQKSLDSYLEEQGLALPLLMEAAGAAVARLLWTAAESCKAALPEVDLLAGPGMNGGDIYVAARKLLARGLSVTVWEAASAARAETGTAASMRRAAAGAGVRLRPLGEYTARPALVADGLLGAGYEPGRELAADLAEALRQLGLAKGQGAYIVACDLPSGVAADSGFVHPLTVAADQTVTFLAPKIGLLQSPACQYNGELIIDNLELPRELLDCFWHTYEAEPGHKTPLRHGEPWPPNLYPNEVFALTPTEFSSLLRCVPSDAHKGSQGHLLAVAGSPGMAGAARLAGEAALRSGTGLVTILCDRAIYPELFAALPSLLYEIPANADSSTWLRSLEARCDRTDAVLLGPGLGRTPRSALLLLGLLTWDQPLVLDADALFALANSAEAQAALRERAFGGKVTILTPHGGEAALLAAAYGLASWNGAARLWQAAALAHATQAWVVLKGEATLVASPAGRVYVNRTGGRGLAKGGSGDILAGLMSALVAQGLSPEAAAPAAVYWHGAAADCASDRLGWRSLAPTDTLAALGEIAPH